MCHEWVKESGPTFISQDHHAVWDWMCKNCGKTILSSAKPYPDEIVNDLSGRAVLSDQCCEDYMAKEIHDQ